MFSLAQGGCFAQNPAMSAHLNPEKASTSPGDPVGDAPIHLSVKPSCLLIVFSLGFPIPASKTRPKCCADQPDAGKTTGYCRGDW